METEMMAGRLVGRGLARQDYTDVRSPTNEPPEPPLTVMTMDRVAKAQADLSEALSEMRSLGSRLFGPEPAEAALGSSAAKPGGIKDELADRLYTLGRQADAVLSLARMLNERI